MLTFLYLTIAIFFITLTLTTMALFYFVTEFLTEWLELQKG